MANGGDGGLFRRNLCVFPEKLRLIMGNNLQHRDHQGGGRRNVSRRNGRRHRVANRRLMIEQLESRMVFSGATWEDVGSITDPMLYERFDKGNGLEIAVNKQYTAVLAKEVVSSTNEDKSLYFQSDNGSPFRPKILLYENSTGLVIREFSIPQRWSINIPGSFPELEISNDKIVFCNFRAQGERGTIYVFDIHSGNLNTTIRSDDDVAGFGFNIVLHENTIIVGAKKGEDQQSSHIVTV